MADIAAQLEKAVQHKIAGEYEEAVVLLKAVLAAEPNNPDAHHELGLVLVFTGAFDESVQELELAVRLNPRSIPFILDFGKTLTMLGEYEKAIPAFEYVLRIDPTNQEAIKNLDFIR